MATAQRQKSGVVVPQQLSRKGRVVASSAALVYWLLIRSWRRVWKDTADNTLTQAPVIYCIWHSHLLLAFASYDDYALEKWHEQGLVAWISASKDGALLAGILAKFGVQTVRGSTSRRGPQSLLEASRWLKKGYSIAMTPDGPRGPAHKIVQEGILSLAQISGRPIIPISNYTRWKICLKNWDKTQIPLPFARCELYDHDPIWVPRRTTVAEREKLRLRLEESMRAITVD